MSSNASFGFLHTFQVQMHNPDRVCTQVARVVVVVVVAVVAAVVVVGDLVVAIVAVEVEG